MVLVIVFILNKGYYIKVNNEDIYLNINKVDFLKYLEQVEDVSGWVRFKIYKREKVANNGLTHNMTHVKKDTTKTD